MNLPFETSEAAAEVAQAMLAPFSPGEYPNLVEFITEHATHPGYDYGDGSSTDSMSSSMASRRRGARHSFRLRCPGS